jgi:hypothetical protein
MNYPVMISAKFRDISQLSGFDTRKIDSQEFRP